jgi:transposase
MAEAYAVELRERVVQAYESGAGSYPVVAAMFRVGEATVRRWTALKRQRGSVEPARKRGGTPSGVTAEQIEAIVTALGDPTALEITAEYNRQRRGAARKHVSSIKRALYRFGYVVKKNAAGRWRVCDRT